MKIAVVGTGYVGMSISALLAQNNHVVALDIVEEKVDLINQKISPFHDDEIQDYLSNRKLNLVATTNKNDAYLQTDIVIIATPTDYDVDKKYFNTGSIEEVVKDVIKINPNAFIVIKSTIPIGYVRDLRNKLGIDNVVYSPEFLREGQALYDNLYPSRIIVGEDSVRARKFAKLLSDSAIKENIPTLFTNHIEAEAIKLFSNSYLAMRVAFFNELDSYCAINDLSSREIIDGVCLDPRIESGYNNPSFGYGGYCLPKDTKQLLANFDAVPQMLIKAIVESNETRIEFIAEQILKLKPKKVGIYRLVMKFGSDNFRTSSIQRVLSILQSETNGVEFLLYEPELKDSKFNKVIKVDSLKNFINESDIIIANRLDDNLKSVRDKVFTRDIYGEN